MTMVINHVSYSWDEPPSMRAKVESDDPDGKLSLPPAFLYQVLQSDLHLGDQKVTLKKLVHIPENY